jgi:hypothetical protein
MAGQPSVEFKRFNLTARYVTAALAHLFTCQSYFFTLRFCCLKEFWVFVYVSDNFAPFNYPFCRTTSFKNVKLPCF